MQFEKIISIKRVGDVKTLDIEVDNEQHVYFANKIATSNSHAVSYAYVGYQTAWVKAHFPEQYICAWLRIAQNEPKPLLEIRGVISEARRLGIKVYGPSIKNMPVHDFFITKGSVAFGISSIKNCKANGLSKFIKKNRDYLSVEWLDFLINHSKSLNSKQMLSMIRTGCFDYMNYSSRMACELEYLKLRDLKLTALQLKKLQACYEETKPKALLDLLTIFVESLSENSAEKFRSAIADLRNPSTDTRDYRSNLIKHEKELLGINITCSSIDRASLPENIHSAQDIEQSNDRHKEFIIVGEISEFREIKIKNGQMAGQLMAVFTLLSKTGDVNVVAFPNELDNFQAGIYDGNVVMIKGKKSNRGGLILNGLYEV